MEREDFFFEYSETKGQSKLFILLIYDITDNGKRVKFAKLLEGYGTRVQKSAFEARLTPQKYDKLLQQIPKYIDNEDSVRIYRIQGSGQTVSFGTYVFEEDEEDIILI